MITLDEYFQDSEANFGYARTQEDIDRATDLLAKVNAFVPECQLRSGHRVPAKTQALIDSGHRAAKGGQHEQSNAVDVSDPDNAIDGRISDADLEDAQLYREAPQATITWCHLQRVAPGSGHRTFFP